MRRIRDLYAMKRKSRDWWGESSGRVRKRVIGIAAIVAGWPLFVMADVPKAFQRSKVIYMCHVIQKHKD
jgi:hypothetical protein